MEINRFFVLLLICLTWSSASCDKWVRHGRKVYLEVTTPMRQPNFLSYCAARSAHGVDIEDSIENNFVKQLLGGTAFWLGIYYAGAWYQWEGAAIAYYPCCFSSIFDGMVINNNSPGEWSDVDSTLNFPGVCESELSLYPDEAIYVPLLTSTGNETAIFVGTANSKSDCASICHRQATCLCFGYDKIAKNCATFNWQPVIQPNSRYFCFKETMH